MSEEEYNMENETDIVYHKYHSRIEERYRLIYGTEIKTIQVKIPKYVYHQMVELKGRLMAENWGDFMSRILFLSRCSFNPDLAAFSAENMERVDPDDEGAHYKDLALEELNRRRQKICGAGYASTESMENLQNKELKELQRQKKVLFEAIQDPELDETERKRFLGMLKAIGKIESQGQ